MDLHVYTVVKEAKEWTISAGGIRIIACRDRRTAVKTVRRATELLRGDETARPSIREPRPSGAAVLDLGAERASGSAGYDLPEAALTA
jgi:hypothetical protein